MTLGDFTPGYMDFAEVFPTTYERDFSIPLKNGEEVGARELKITKAIHDYSIKRVHGKLTYRDNVSGERKKLTLDQFTQLLGKRRDGRYFQVQDMHVAIPHLMKAGVVTPYDFSRQTGTEAANMFGRDEEFPKEGSTIKQIIIYSRRFKSCTLLFGEREIARYGNFF
jgi:hypothetical protein